jgi:23S rRNA pseudouridine1911/1915/1917 synthase
MSLESDNLREARTHFTLEEALPAASLLRVRLETGRTHQIRAHFEAIGHPVCGDPQYGHGNDYGLSRQFLHAAHLELAQPSTGAALSFDSPLPADLAAALKRARGA